MPELGYSSPVSTTSSHGRVFRANVGLGISDCGLESSYDPMTSYSNQLPFPVNHTMSNNLMSVETIYNLPLEADDFCGRSCYELYNGHPNPPQSSLGFYGAQSMSMTHSYDPAMEVGACQGAYLGQLHQMTGPWANTPTISAPPTPIQSIPAAADRTMENPWDHGIYMEPNTPFQSQAIPQSRTSNAPIPLANQSSACRPTSEDHKKNIPIVSRSQGLSASESTPEASKTTKRGRKPSAEKGCNCPVCGFYFTRRSNCVAHQKKKHDPTFHRAIPCEECSKSFGRNADLRRHIDTVSGALSIVEKIGADEFWLGSPWDSQARLQMVLSSLYSVGKYGKVSNVS
jgi:hypothetical protein